MCHWFSPDAPVRVSSFGGLQHFRKSGKPAMAGDATRCLDCAYETQCPYSAKKSEFSHPSFPLSAVRGRRNSTFDKVYLDRVSRGHTGWPVRPLVDEIPDIENVTEAITHGPYGRCVYECDNDVCDNQVCDTPTRPHSPLSAGLTTHAVPRSSTSNMRQAQPPLSRWSPTPRWSVSDRPACISPLARSSAT